MALFVVDSGLGATAPSCPDKRIEDYTRDDLLQCWGWCTANRATVEANPILAAVCAGIAARLPESDTGIAMTDAQRYAAGTSLLERSATARTTTDPINAARAALPGAVARIDAVNSAASGQAPRGNSLLYAGTCGPELFNSKIWLFDLYVQAQAQLRALLSVPAGRRGETLRTWAELTAAWIGVAHAASAIHVPYLYSAGTFVHKGVSTQLVGPDSVLQYQAREVQKAVDAGARRVLELTPSLARYTPRMSPKGSGHDWANPGEFCALYREGGTRCTAVIFCEPEPGQVCGVKLDFRALFYWAIYQSGDPISVRELARRMSPGDTRYDHDVLDTIFVFTGTQIEQSLRHYAQNIVDTPLVTHVGVAFERFTTRLAEEVARVAAYNGVDPDTILGASVADLRKLGEGAARAGWQAKSQAYGAGVTALLSFTGAVGAAVGAVIGLLLSALGEILPLASSPWIPPLFLYRSPEDPACNFTVSGDRSTLDALDRVVVAGQSVGINIKNPFRPPPDLPEGPVDEMVVEDKPFIMPVAVGVLAGLAAAFALLR